MSIANEELKADRYDSFWGWFIDDAHGIGAVGSAHSKEFADLFSAAPDMLGVLKTVEPIVRANAQPITHDFLLAAIRKAEGGD